jgi:hypothetical protein
VLAYPITWTLSVLAGKSGFGITQAVGVVAVAFGVFLAVGLASLRYSLEHGMRVLLAAWRRAA